MNPIANKLMHITEEYRKEVKKISKLKLSAGHIARRKTQELFTGHDLYYSGDMYSSQFNIDLLPSGNYYYKCECQQCGFCVKEFKLCICTTGRCYMEDNERDFPGMETRGIIRSEA